MIFRVIFGTLLAGALQCGWGMFIWMQSGLAFHVLHTLPNEAEIVPVLSKNIDKPGVYLSPWWNEADLKGPDKDKAMAQMMEKHKQGPLVHVVFQPQGIDPQQPVVMAMGFGHTFAMTLFACMVMAMAAPGLATFGRRFRFVVLIGFFVALGPLADVAWMHHPWQYPAFLASFLWIGWLLSAPLLALIIKAKAQPAPAE